MRQGIAKPSTTVVSTRCDIRFLAAIAKFYQSLNDMPETRSKLIRRIIEDFYSILISSEKIEPISSTLDAFSYLSSNGLKPSDRGRSMLINQINIETIVGKDHDEVVTPELVKAAVESMKNERK